MNSAELLGLILRLFVRMQKYTRAWHSLSKSPAPSKAAWLRANYLAIAGSYWFTIDLARGRHCFQEGYKQALEYLNFRRSRFDLMQHEVSWQLRAACLGGMREDNKYI